MSDASRPQRGTKPTIVDVARVAGVSQATTSRALNDSPLVTEATRLRVRQAALEIGFVMNARGRQLAVGRSEAIAVLVTEPLDELFTDPTHAQLLRGVTEGLAASPSVPVLVQAWSDDEHKRALRLFERRAVDAVIHISPHVGGTMLEALKTQTLPVVICGQLKGHPYRGIFSNVYADDVAGASLAGRRMVQRGRRRIAVINGPLTNPAAADRAVGYRQSLGNLWDESIVVSSAWDSSAGIEAMRRLLALEPGIDAVLAASDRMAMGALTALELAGRSVPTDVSVIGFDDHPIAANAVPPLTTVHQPMIQEGQIAAALALEMLSGAEPRTVVLEMNLVERASV